MTPVWWFYPDPYAYSCRGYVAQYLTDPQTPRAWIRTSHTVPVRP